MNRIKIPLSKEISGSVEVGQLFRVQSVDDQVVLVRMPDDQGPPLSHETKFMDPEIYVGSNWDGLSFEIPAAYVHRFLVSLGHALQPEKITIYFRRNGSEEVLTSSLDDYEDKLAIAGERCLDHSFMVEFDEHTLFTGGEGCFSLQAEVGPAKLQQIAQTILDELEVEHRLDREDFQVAVINGQVKVIR
jgi:hypothetical protein